jgi:cell division protein FtsB
MNVTFIIAVALATVIMLIIIGLIIALAYYKWRTTELLSGIALFVNKNRELEAKIDELLSEIRRLKKEKGID